MGTDVFLVALVIGAGSALIWNQYEYLQLVTERTGAPFPVVGSGLGWYLQRPWRIFSGFDDLVRVESATQTDPWVETARRRYLLRRRAVLLVFAVAGSFGLLFSPDF